MSIKGMSSISRRETHHAEEQCPDFLL